MTTNGNGTKMRNVTILGIDMQIPKFAIETKKENKVVEFRHYWKNDLSGNGPILETLPVRYKGTVKWFDSSLNREIKQRNTGLVLADDKRTLVPLQLIATDSPA